ncbi:MAG: riboflavin synthase [Coriobacteriia bacterium]|nr:riboflavin synthase [Coriobacteriia bacterium]
MFTGIVEELGTVKDIRRGTHSAMLCVSATRVLEDAQVGDSIAVNGVCLTVTQLTPSQFSADVMHETLNRSSLGTLRAGSPVNLERAMAANGRFGGHIVSGHIDATGTIQRIWSDDNAVWYTVSAPAAVLRYVVEKGSVALDGISLTVAQVAQNGFSVSVIPHTQQVTNLATKQVGDRINIETDIIGKYVEKLLISGAVPGAAGAAEAAAAGAVPLTFGWLAANGF